mgnify:CR=1 FL=1
MNIYLYKRICSQLNTGHNYLTEFLMLTRNWKNVYNNVTKNFTSKILISRELTAQNIRLVWSLKAVPLAHQSSTLSVHYSNSISANRTLLKLTYSAHRVTGAAVYIVGICYYRNVVVWVHYNPTLPKKTKKIFLVPKSQKNIFLVHFLYNIHNWLITFYFFIVINF